MTIRHTGTTGALLTASLAALAALVPCKLEAATARLGLPVMGTILQVEVVAANKETATVLCRQAMEIAKAHEDLLTTWRPEGELAALNEQAGRGQVETSYELHRALSLMLALSDATAGAFDPSVGMAVEFWRRPPGDGSAAPPTTAPGFGKRLAIGSRDTETSGVQYWALLLEGVRLDAGAIGKGMALDAITEMLRSRGATAAFLDFGGSSQAAFGTPEKGGTWTVALPSLTGVAGTTKLAGLALSTSIASKSGAAAGPIIDPRSMRPVATPRLATVIATDAATAEAWSTALVVLGPGGIVKATTAGVQAMFEDRAGRVPARPRSRGGAGLEDGGLEGAEEHH